MTNSFFQSYKGRQEPWEGQMIKVYKNLHNGLWSIKDAQTNLVLGHMNKLELRDCEFIVSQAGRARVIKEGKKNVHAYVMGKYSPVLYEPLAFDNKAYYNPYKVEHFTTEESDFQRVLTHARQVSLFASSSSVYFE